MANTISTIGTGTATVELADLGLTERGNANLVSAQSRMEGVTINAFDLSRCSVMAYYPEASNLTGTDVDPRSRTPSFKATSVWFE